MARIRGLEEGKQSVGIHPTEVECFYQTVKGDNGEVYLHLTTFGSDGRQSKPKSSQSMQLSREVAKDLARLIDTIFP